MANVLCRRLLIGRASCIKELVTLATYPASNVITVSSNRSSKQSSYDDRFVWLSVQRNIVKYSTDPHNKVDGDKDQCSRPPPPEEAPEKEKSLFQKLKEMYKNYWYVLVPVHLVTSAVWFGGFYYMAKSGIDIVAILESMHISEKLINPLRDSKMGYIAVAYALYKIATPLRYTVTIGGTTISINYLTKLGYIKPVPNKEALKQMYTEKRDSIKRTMKEKKDDILETKENILETIEETKEELKDKKDNILKNVSKTADTLKKKTKGIAEQFSAADMKDKGK